jgi:hypothetical protein
MKSTNVTTIVYTRLILVAPDKAIACIDSGCYFGIYLGKISDTAAFEGNTIYFSINHKNYPDDAKLTDKINSLLIYT